MLSCSTDSEPMTVDPEPRDLKRHQRWAIAALARQATRRAAQRILPTICAAGVTQA